MPKHFDMFSDATKFAPEKRLEDCSGVCITDQEAVCTITEIMAICGNDLSVARDKFNNHLLFESALGGVLIDQLNASEVEAYRKREAENKQKLADAEAERLAFETFKAEMAKRAQESAVPSTESQTPTE